MVLDTRAAWIAIATSERSAGKVFGDLRAVLEEFEHHALDMIEHAARDPASHRQALPAILRQLAADLEEPGYLDALVFIYLRDPDAARHRLLLDMLRLREIASAIDAALAAESTALDSRAGAVKNDRTSLDR